MNVVPQDPGTYHIAHFAKPSSILNDDETGRPKLTIRPACYYRYTTISERRGMGS